MNRTYHIWTIGCQMNAADARRLAEGLALAGYVPAAVPEAADLAILNTCVVRQRSEDKAYSQLGWLRKVKKRRPGMQVALMGCLVGPQASTALRERFPFVDYFVAPSDYDSLLAALPAAAEPREPPTAATAGSVCALVPAVLGCSHACAFCVIPSRRGPERSRPMADILAEARRLVDQGAREITILGQIVDRYGLDLDPRADLALLLRRLAETEDLLRIRFLTSHPNWISAALIDAVAETEKICPQWEIALQSGSDRILARMRRGYDCDKFLRLVDRIRNRLPAAAIHTDIIAGFPGETVAEFEDSMRLLARVEFDTVHVVKYSTRPGTYAAAQYVDDVPDDEKERRRAALDALQKEIQTRQNSRLLGQAVEILVERQDRGRWHGRTRENKIVFAAGAGGETLGGLARVLIEWAGPFSLIGRCVPAGGTPA